MDYDESIRVMNEFISHHPIAIPLTKTPNPKFLSGSFILHLKGSRLKTMWSKPRSKVIALCQCQNKLFSKQLGYHKTPRILSWKNERLKTFLNDIGNSKEFKAKKFKKSAIPGLWTVLTHLVLRGLSIKHGGTDMMRKDWFHVVYNIYFGRSNVVDLIKILWQEFWKFAIKMKPQEISSPRFWALTLQQMYRERQEHIPITTKSKELFLSFKTIKTYRLLNQSSFEPTRRLPQHMLATLPWNII